MEFGHYLRDAGPRFDGKLCNVRCNRGNLHKDGRSKGGEEGEG